MNGDTGDIKLLLQSLLLTLIICTIVVALACFDKEWAVLGVPWQALMGVGIALTWLTAMYVSISSLNAVFYCLLLPFTLIGGWPFYFASIDYGARILAVEFDFLVRFAALGFLALHGIVIACALWRQR